MKKAATKRDTNPEKKEQGASNTTNNTRDSEEETPHKTIHQKGDSKKERHKKTEARRETASIIRDRGASSGPHTFLNVLLSLSFSLRLSPYE